ncbi:MAG: DUF4331 family protein [Marinirhabdus sp.]
MKKTKFFAVIGSLAVAIAAVFLIAADHFDSPSVAGQPTDIADLYAFEGDNPDNTVLIATVQGRLVPGASTDQAAFSENVLVEFNIDNTNDFVEDLVIQAIKRGDSMYFFGPVAPSQTGLSSTVETSVGPIAVKISSSEETETATENGITVFAGPRRDYFYFDSNQFNEVISGMAPNGFDDPGSDFYEALNVLAISVEVPNSMLGDAPIHIAEAAGLVPPGTLPNTYNVWVATKTKQ